MSTSILRNCEAMRVNDEMHCGRCGLTWGLDDPDAPSCAPRIDKRAIPTRAATVRDQRQRAGFAEQAELRQALLPSDAQMAALGARMVIRNDARFEFDLQELLTPTPRRPGCYNQPRPVPGAVTHCAQDGWNEGGEPGTPQHWRTPKWVPVRFVCAAGCQYDRRTIDPACKGCYQSCESTESSSTGGSASGATPGGAGV